MRRSARWAQAGTAGWAAGGALWALALAMVLLRDGDVEGGWLAGLVVAALGALAAAGLHMTAAWGLATQAAWSPRVGVAAALVSMPQLPWGPVVAGWTLWGAVRLDPAPPVVSRSRTVAELGAAALVGMVLVSVPVGLAALALVPCGCEGPPVTTPGVAVDTGLGS